MLHLGGVEAISVFTLGLFLLIIFILLLALTASYIYRTLWWIAGREVVEAGPDILKVARQIFGWRSIREYRAAEVKDLHTTVEQSGSVLLTSIRRLWGLDGRIAFDYGAKTFRFGLEIEEAEAKQIISVIKVYLPQHV